MKRIEINKNEKTQRSVSFGYSDLSILDRLGIWLSRKAILRELVVHDKIDVLEIGCGFQARNLIAIKDKASSLTGIDFKLSPELSDINEFYGIEGSIDDAMPNLGDKKFDLILIISVLEHLENPVKVLSQCRSLLKPDAILLINVPTWRGKLFLEFSAFRLGLSPKLEMDDHKMYYDKRDLWPVIVASGFLPSQIRMRYHKFGLNLFAKLKLYD